MGGVYFLDPPRDLGLCRGLDVLDVARPNVGTLADIFTLLKGLKWDPPPKRKPKNIVGIYPPGLDVSTIVIYSYYILGVPCLGFPFQLYIYVPAQHVAVDLEATKAHLGVSQNYGDFLGMPTTRTIALLGLYWGSPMHRNYHLVRLLGGA